MVKLRKNTYECDSSIMLELSRPIWLGLSMAEIWGEAPGRFRVLPGAGAVPKVGTSGTLLFEF